MCILHTKRRMTKTENRFNYVLTNIKYVLSVAIFIGCVDAWHVRVGVLVCGFRAFGLRKLRPRVELQSHMGQAEKLGYGAETKRQVGYGYETFVMSSSPTRNGETAVLHVERANSA